MARKDNETEETKQTAKPRATAKRTSGKTTKTESVSKARTDEMSAVENVSAKSVKAVAEKSSASIEGTARKSAKTGEKARSEKKVVKAANVGEVSEGSAAKVMRLNNLKARNGIDSKPLGRGIGSGRGKTSTFGHKGGKARSGRGKVVWFEGGQTPIYRRLPKRGFHSMKDRSCIGIINLGDLQRLCDAKVLKADQEVTVDVLKELGAVRDNVSNLRLLADGKLSVSLHILANYASDAAVRGVEAVGGKVQIV